MGENKLFRALNPNSMGPVHVSLGHLQQVHTQLGLLAPQQLALDGIISVGDDELVTAPVLVAPVRQVPPDDDGDLAAPAKGRHHPVFTRRTTAAAAGHATRSSD